MSLSPELLCPVVKDERRLGLEVFVRPPATFLQDSWRRFRSNKLALVGLSLIALVFLVAIFGPMLSPYTSTDQDLLNGNIGPSRAHWLGTDLLGRDVLTRTMYGARISLTVGVFASLINLTLGLLWGGIAGFAGGKIDNVMMRIVDVLYGVPFLLYVILLMVILKPGLQNILIAIGVIYWLDMARIVRGQVLTLKQQDYTLAARTIGTSSMRILLRHLLPNALGPIIVTLTLKIPEAIFTEAFLAFIGLGVPPPDASWGTLAQEGLATLRIYPWQLLSPAIAICITMLGFNFVGDGLRDAFDPRERR